MFISRLRSTFLLGLNVYKLFITAVRPPAVCKCLSILLLILLWNAIQDERIKSWLKDFENRSRGESLLIVSKDWFYSAHKYCCWFQIHFEPAWTTSGTKACKALDCSFFKFHSFFSGNGNASNWFKPSKVLSLLFCQLFYSFNVEKRTLDSEFHNFLKHIKYSRLLIYS